ncbi:Elastase inhibitor AFLEI Flags: Precursor [Xanthomonas melonis]|uniref:Elastase inhibitor AFLEI Flags n=1 Tax=Xanthomonas melonis TaxID=56456 RepID=A0ABS8NTC5_9XANT|nr:I78 family peptidase inhibitor [Xanthomonas melonis]MCD0258095.1 Elastase inhibitor AFLEI Flags: Precursor [Xanthomonas melonis]MCD0266315.1 Elastase inhibitor AFLEI Flags: Precursor [Xanthomonas melonis]MCD0278346.1 Elastase inhibitor AFLEI Flags: Precursor [Xanthomonas melonis]
MRTVPPIARVACSLLALAALSACNKPQPDEQEAVTAKAQQAAEQASAPAPATAPEAPPIGSCDATQVQSLVGQPMTDAAGEQARNDAGAKSVRVLKPGQMVTMEFNGERLNLEVDAKNIVTSVRCG